MPDYAFDVGDTIRLRAMFNSTANTPVDPSVITFTIRTPSGSEFSAVYPSTSTTVIHPSSGLYLTDYLIPTPGTYRYRVQSTGIGLNTAAESAFVARKQWVGTGSVPSSSSFIQPSSTP